jgi:uncharacterized repeat protein (TIGR01451 family)
MTSLGTLPSSLRTIISDETALNNLTMLPNGLERMEITNHSITNLPSLPNSLKVFRAPFNYPDYEATIAVLPTLPPNLEELDIAQWNINAIPNYPNSLKTIIAREVPLYSLGTTLPASLEYLEIWSDSISVIPALPAGMKTLIAQAISGGITSLPAIPDGLIKLDVWGNNLSTLPTLPPTLQYLNINSNPISCVPKLPTVMSALYISNTNVQCLPNTVFTQNAIPPLSSFPICDTGNVNGCPVYWNVGGKFFVDANTNCTLDQGEELINFMNVDYYRNGVPLSAGSYLSSGGFSLDGHPNDTIVVKLDTNSTPFILSCGQTDTNLIILSATDTISIENNFSLSCPSGFDISAQSIVANTNFRNAQPTAVHLFAGSYAQFYGVTSCPAPLGTVTATISGASHITSANPTPFYISAAGDSIVWDAVDFFTTSLFNGFDLYMLTDTTAPIGSQVCINLSVTPVTGDNDPANNTTSQCFTIVNSYDPNDKQVSPPGDLPAYYGDWLTYTIRFQNTGTAEAFNIRVEDTLSSLLDMNTFQLLSYSFPPQLNIDGNVVNFLFNNINLPDSFTNEPGSHGFVQFRIKPLTWLMPNQPVNNTGYIYFDFNPAIVTNTVTSEVVNPTAVNTINTTPDIDALVYPNPAKDRWYVQVSGLNKDENYTVTVTDMSGRVVNRVLPASAGQAISVARNGASSGVYFMRIATNTGKAITRKVIWQ